MAPPTEPPPAPLKTYQSLLTTFSTFLTVAIHSVLHVRALYPPSTFLSTRKYNFPVQQSRHPKVCQWIIDAVAAVEAEMLKGSVDRVAVVVFEPKSGRAVERYVFDVGSWPVLGDVAERWTEFGERNPEQGESGTASGSAIVGGAGSVSVGGKRGLSIVDIEEQLRATIRNLVFRGNKLPPLPEGCTFTVAVELKDSKDAEAPIGHGQKWVPSEPGLQQRERESPSQSGETGKQSERVGRERGGVKSVPVRVVEAGEFVVEMWIEEGRKDVEGG